MWFARTNFVRNNLQENDEKTEKLTHCVVWDFQQLQTAYHCKMLLVGDSKHNGSLTFTCSKSTIETLENSVKHV